MCERHQGMRSASRAGISDRVTFFSIEYRERHEYDRILNIQRSTSNAQRPTFNKAIRQSRNKAILQVSGKGVSVEMSVETSVETPMKTLGETPGKSSPIGSPKTPLKSKGETTQETREITREKILGLVCTSANISTDEMAAQLGVTRKGIEWHIRKLKAENLLRRIGPDKGGHWEVLK